MNITRECFMGNTLHNAQPSQQADCSEVCSGDLMELCGGELRTQVYRDSTWFDPNAVQLATALQEYNDTLAQFLDARQPIPVRNRTMAVRNQDIHHEKVLCLVAAKTGGGPPTHTATNYYSKQYEDQKRRLRHI